MAEEDGDIADEEGSSRRSETDNATTDIAGEGTVPSEDEDPAWRLLQVASRTRKITGGSPLSVDPGFLQFAQWAFSEVGLPGLQVLAWGDFSYEDRWAWHDALLCRDESLLERAGFNFRTILALLPTT
ncbi:hypothetical protein OIDMADRAFT_56320 [Oidiodendron maius Zn]|uniref:Uncharacterized protein n=1 Tax=Oidiodendron maius (strain Zn) TaxID=913774 RepID=A0A0C3GT36_OIDMZ|nr:hypothetical protein OIDMADRAFT_56320 [Oidiodendron maius Zn]